MIALVQAAPVAAVDEHQHRRVGLRRRKDVQVLVRARRRSARPARAAACASASADASAQRLKCSGCAGTRSRLLYMRSSQCAVVAGAHVRISRDRRIILSHAIGDPLPSPGSATPACSGMPLGQHHRMHARKSLMSLYAKLQQRAAAGQAGARRPDRGRQVRLDVPGADSAHARRAPGGHRGPLARRRARQPGARGLEGRSSAGRLARRGAQGRHHPRRRGLAGAGAPSRDRRHRRMHRPSDRRRRPLPGSLRQRQARRQRHGGSRRVLRAAAGAQGRRRPA